MKTFSALEFSFSQPCMFYLIAIGETFTRCNSSKLRKNVNKYLNSIFYLLTEIKFQLIKL